SVYTVPGDVVIYGYKNSTAEAYAKKYNREFIAFDTSTDTPGDINCDGTVSIADLVSLQNFLLGRTKTLGNWKNADLCKDDRLDVFDMVLMRRLLIEKMN
uniref:dockerin type I repeat-containing protein n=1 Tax=uncultured Ruminococcus sp. TaxID=165186 RepID=UPI0025D78AB0